MQSSNVNNNSQQAKINHYLQQAKETVSRIRGKLKYGSNALIDDHKSDHKRSFVLRATVLLSSIVNACIFKKGADFPVMTALNTAAINKYGYGQCGELSQAAFLDLVNNDVYPIDFCITSQGFHNLIVIGRDPHSDDNDISTWGNEAVICDVWADKVYRLADFKKMQSDKEYGRYSKKAEKMVPGCLDGLITIQESIKTIEELNQFKEKVDIHPEIKKVQFKKTIETEEDLIKDFNLITSQYHSLSNSSVRDIPGVALYLSSLKEYIDTLNLVLTQKYKESRPSQFFKK